jgi:hypothetical protein
MNLGYKPIIYNDVNFTLDPDRAFYLLNNSDVQTITFPTNLGDKYDGYIYKFKRTRVGSVVRNTIFRIDNSQNRFLKTDNTADNSFSPSGSPYYFEIMWKSDFNGGMYIVLFSS